MKEKLFYFSIFEGRNHYSGFSEAKFLNKVLHSHCTEFNWNSPEMEEYQLHEEDITVFSINADLGDCYMTDNFEIICVKPESHRNQNRK